MALFSDAHLEAMRDAVAPWDGWTDDVLEDVAETRGGVRQLLMVDTPEGERIRTGAGAARLVLELRRIIRACGYGGTLPLAPR
jgi:hypothetical protein